MYPLANPGYSQENLDWMASIGARPGFLPPSRSSQRWSTGATGASAISPTSPYGQGGEQPWTASDGNYGYSRGYGGYSPTSYGSGYGGGGYGGGGGMGMSHQMQPGGQGFSAVAPQPFMPGGGVSQPKPFAPSGGGRSMPSYYQGGGGYSWTNQNPNQGAQLGRLWGG